MAATVKLYVIQACGYCRAAERLLAQKGVAYERQDVTGDQRARQWLAEQTGRTTLPQVFIAGRSVGGYDDLSALDKRGELDRLLADG